MTAPAGPVLGRPADQDRRDQQTLNYEHALEAAALAATVAAIAGAVGMALALVSSGVPVPVVRQRFVAALRAVPVEVESGIRARWPQGVALGASNALADLGGQPVATSSPTVREVAAQVTPQDADVAKLLARVDRDLQAGIDKAVTLAETLPIETPADVTAVQAKATQAVNQTRAQISWVAQSAVHAGTAAVAEQSDAWIVWIAERDACLVCLALSGHVIKAGGAFDANATFGTRMPLFPINDPQALTGPPRHPHCRCSTRLYTGNPESKLGLPATLRREAERSVARGFSNHASKKARLRAADRLVRRANRLPNTVNARAKRDVARGDFSDRHNDRLPALPPGRG